MWRLARFVILAVVAVLLLVFAFANRQIVAVSFDPFVSDEAPAFALTAPLFLVLMLTLILGVAVGGAAVWLSQGRFRRAARQHRAEADRLRARAASVPSMR